MSVAQLWLFVTLWSIIIQIFLVLRTFRDLFLSDSQRHNIILLTMITCCALLNMHTFLSCESRCFFFGWAGSSLRSAGRGGYHSSAWASHHGCFSCCGVQVLGLPASVVAVLGSREHGPEVVAHGLKVRSMGSFWTRNKPAFTALAGRFLSTTPPRKS